MDQLVSRLVAPFSQSATIKTCCMKSSKVQTCCTGGGGRNADQVQNLQLLLLLLPTPPPTKLKHSFRGCCTKSYPSQAKPALEKPLRLRSKSHSVSPLPPQTPHQLPLPPDHLVGGGGEELPRPALLSWRRTLLSLVAPRTARGFRGWQRL